MPNIEEITKCRLCESEKLTEYISFGNVPLANYFVEDGSTAPRFPLTVVRCEDCSSHQLKHNVSESILFNENYAYSTPPSLASHFETFAGEVVRDLNLNDQSVVVDIGGNNGLLLSYFQQLTPNIINVEPSKNVAEESKKRGIPTVCEFFGSQTNHLFYRKGFALTEITEADVIISSNVFAHSKNVLDMMKGVKGLLKKGGIFIQENAYWIDTLKNNDFGQIYNEHFFYHTISSLFKVYQSLGMTLYKVTFNKTSQMGSFRVYVKNYPNYPIEDSVREAIQYENFYMGKVSFFESNYNLFKDKADDIGKQLIRFLEKNKDRRIGLVGVPAKSVLLIDYFKIEPYIYAAYEDAPLKIGKQIPGTNINIKPMEELVECDVVVVGAYNFAHHIMDRFKMAKLEWCIPLPEFHIQCGDGTGKISLR
jgi:SAM-dependent methyltransferase